MHAGLSPTAVLKVRSLMAPVNETAPLSVPDWAQVPLPVDWNVPEKLPPDCDLMIHVSSQLVVPRASPSEYTALMVRVPVQAATALG